MKKEFCRFSNKNQQKGARDWCTRLTNKVSSNK